MAQIVFKQGSTSNFQLLLQGGVFTEGTLYFIKEGDDITESSQIIRKGQIWLATSNSAIIPLSDGFVKIEPASVGPTEDANSNKLNFTRADGTATTIDFSALDPSGIKEMLKIAKDEIVIGNATSNGVVSSGKKFITSIVENDASNAEIPTEKAIVDYVKVKFDNVLAAGDAMVFKGTIASEEELTALKDYKTGWTYKVTTPFKSTSLDQQLEAGDMIITITDYDASYKASDFTVIQNNVDLVGAKGTIGLVKNDSDVTSKVGYTPVPIIDGIPYYKDTNTEYAITAGNGTTAGNAAVGSGTNDVYVKLDSGSAVSSKIHLVGSGATKVSSDASGKITIQSTDTHYEASLVVGKTGATTNAATVNGETNLILRENGTTRTTLPITGTGLVSVTSNAQGAIKIDANLVWGTF